MISLLTPIWAYFMKAIGYLSSVNLSLFATDIVWVGIDSSESRTSILNSAKGEAVTVEWGKLRKAFVDGVGVG